MCSYSHRKQASAPVLRRQVHLWLESPLSSSSRLKAGERRGDLTNAAAESRGTAVHASVPSLHVGCKMQERKLKPVAASSFGSAAPFLDLSVAEERCDLGFNLGCDFLWGFLNCLCSVCIAKGLCVAVGVFAFLSEYGCCLFLPSLSPSLCM